MIFFVVAPAMAASAKPPSGPPVAGKEVDNNAPRLFKKSHAIALDLFMDRLDGMKYSFI